MQQIQRRPHTRNHRIRAITLIERCRKELAKKREMVEREKAHQQKEDDQITAGKPEQERGGQGEETNHPDDDDDDNGIITRIARPIASFISKFPKPDPNKSPAVTNSLAGALNRAAAIRPLKLPP